MFVSVLILIFVLFSFLYEIMVINNNGNYWHFTIFLHQIMINNNIATLLLALNRNQYIYQQHILNNNIFDIHQN